MIFSVGGEKNKGVIPFSCQYAPQINLFYVLKISHQFALSPNEITDDIVEGLRLIKNIVNEGTFIKHSK